MTVYSVAEWDAFSTEIPVVRVFTSWDDVLKVVARQDGPTPAHSGLSFLWRIPVSETRSYIIREHNL